jgi:hypothetical protein
VIEDLKTASILLLYVGDKKEIIAFNKMFPVNYEKVHNDEAWKHFKRLLTDSKRWKTPFIYIVLMLTNKIVNIMRNGLIQ